MGSVSVQLGLLAVAKDRAHADLADVEIATARATTAGHRVVVQEVVGDSEAAIRLMLERWIADPAIDVIIVLGGADSDAVSNAIRPLVGHVLPGFTDLFRYLFFQEAGASAMLSAAEAARCSDTFVFVLPGAVAAAMDKLIIPQFDPTTTPKNLVGQMPRLRTERENAPEPTSDEASAGHGVPREVTPEKTQGGSGMPARLPAIAAPRREQKRTGANVISRTPASVDPQTKPIDLARLEQEIAASQKDDVTRRTDLQKLLPRVPPGADDLDDLDDVTHADIIAAPPAKPFTVPAKPMPAIARITPVPAMIAKPPERATPVPVDRTVPADRLTPLPERMSDRTAPADRVTPLPERQPLPAIGKLPAITKTSPAVAKPVDTKTSPAVAKPVESSASPGAVKAVESRPVESRSAASSGAAKPVESRPVESRSAASSGAAKPVESRPVESRSAASPGAAKADTNVLDTNWLDESPAESMPVGPVTIQPRKRESGQAKPIEKPGHAASEKSGQAKAIEKPAPVEATSNGAGKHAPSSAAKPSSTANAPSSAARSGTANAPSSGAKPSSSAPSSAKQSREAAEEPTTARGLVEAKTTARGGQNAQMSRAAEEAHASRDADDAQMSRAGREAQRSRDADDAQMSRAGREAQRSRDADDAQAARAADEAKTMARPAVSPRSSGSIGVLSDADIEPVDTDDGADLDAIRAAATAQNDEAPTVRAEPVRAKMPTTPPVTMISAVPPAPAPAPPRTRPPSVGSTAPSPAASATDTPRARPATAPPPPRTTSELPRGTFNYPVQKRGMHWALKMLLVLLVLGAGFGGFVFFFRDKLTGEESVVGSNDGSNDGSNEGSNGGSAQIDATMVAAVEIDAAIEVDAAEPEIEMTPTPTPTPPPTTSHPTKTPHERPPRGERTKPEKIATVVDAGVPTPPTGPSNTPPGAGDDECDETACVLSKYEKACCAKYKPAETSELTTRAGGVPETLDKIMVRAGVNGVKPKVVKCGEKIAVKGTVKISMTVSPAGAVTDASLADAPDPSLGECVVAAMKLAKFGKSVNGATFTYPFVF